MKIVWLDRDTFGPSVEIKKPDFPHEWAEFGKTPPDLVSERLADADIAITNKVPIRSSQIENLPQLRMIAVAATGYDVIDVPACTRSGIVVSNVRGYAQNTVPEHVFALILALSRSTLAYRQDVIDGQWQRAGQFCFHHHPVRDLAGHHLGIIGAGVLGQGVARLGQAFGMHVHFAARKGQPTPDDRYTDFYRMLEISDVISINAPLNDETRNLLSMTEFQRMERRPLVINCARGGIVNERDLVDALKQELIAGIGFDVLTGEPPQADNPLLEVLSWPNVIVTPHVAWAGADAMQACWDQVVEHIENFHRGHPSNQVA